MSEPACGPTGPGTVVLDLGPGVGALIVRTPARLNGREIEISSAGSAAAARRTHARVRERRVGSGQQYAAVYPGVPAGRYTVWLSQDAAAGTVEIASGAVTSFEWPG
ncbi:MAG: hypothetical protein ACLPN6_12030 [Streptosporangiaceae bacterium]|jgi:hypothetical protein